MPAIIVVRCPCCKRDQGIDWTSVVYRDGLMISRCPGCSRYIVVGQYRDE